MSNQTTEKIAEAPQEPAVALTQDISNALADLQNISLTWQDGAVALGFLLALLVGGVLVGRYLGKLIEKAAHKTKFTLDNILVDNLKAPFTVFFPVLAYFVVTPFYRPEALKAAPLLGPMKILFVIFFTWMFMRAVNVMTTLILRKFDPALVGERRARRVQTQISILSRISHFVIILLGIAAIFMMFETLRGIGVSMLASAGVAGLIIGFSAQKMLGNLLAGIQIALSQPISIDDVVIVEGEWGRIEEITLTYVVVKIWDLRRLIVPISYFSSNAFENWTRGGKEILGTVSLFMDYTVPVDAVRKKLDELLDGNPRWDGKAKSVLVVGASPSTIEVRLLASSANSGDSWDLRCELREKMIAFIRTNYPDALPRLRTQAPGSIEESDFTPGMG